MALYSESRVRWLSLETGVDQRVLEKQTDRSLRAEQRCFPRSQAGPVHPSGREDFVLDVSYKAENKFLRKIPGKLICFGWSYKEEILKPNSRKKNARDA